MASRTLLVTCLVVASLGVAGVAAAEPSAADKETARGLMSEGRAGRDKGDLKAALKAFAAADSIMHVPTTGVEVAKTQAAIGQLVEARDTALKVMRSPESANEPGPFKAAREAATSLAQELETRIPSVVITVKGVPENATPMVTIDDAPIPSAALGDARKINPGHHVIVAKAGGVDAKQEVDLAEKEKKEVAIELPAAGANAAAGAGQGAGDAASTEQPADAGGGKSGFSKAMLIGGFSVAGIGLVAGTITGVMSMSKTSSIKSSSGCAGSVCGPAEYDDISSARSMATISTVSFVVAGVGAVAGVIGLLTGNTPAGASTEPAPAAMPEKAPEETKESRRVHVQPWIGLGAAGLTGSF
jgi:hypothetical protein